MKVYPISAIVNEVCVSSLRIVSFIYLKCVLRLFCKLATSLEIWYFTNHGL